MAPNTRRVNRNGNKSQVETVETRAGGPALVVEGVSGPSPPPIEEVPPPPTVESTPTVDAVRNGQSVGEGDSDELASEKESEKGSAEQREEEEKESGEEGKRDSGEEKESDGGGETEGEGQGGEGERGVGELNNSDDRSESRTDSVDSAALEGTTALKPLRMYFPPSEYQKKIKISTRCYVGEVLETLDNLNPPLNHMERQWFENHPQFKHMFHMPRDNNHKLMGMWMTILRTACTEKRREAWFIVNGVPIRYSLREHALISGLNCQNYPLSYKEKGSNNFVRKYFERGATIRCQDVKAKLVEMEPSVDRLKMAVLFFLSKIIIGNSKVGKDAPSVEPFFLRAVDDLKLCKSFPWGRLSFEHMLKEISHTVDHFGGEVKEGVIWPIPGFCIPLELLAFEAIPALGLRFRVPCLDANDSCPRMCKSKFKKSEMKGFPLSKINKALGTTKDIESIIISNEGEDRLLRKITEQDDDVDEHDVVVNSWMKRLREGYTVWFEDMYNADVAARVPEEADDVQHEDAANETPLSAQTTDMEARMQAMENKVNDWHLRMQEMEKKVNVWQTKMQELGDDVGSWELRIKAMDEKVNGLNLKMEDKVNECDLSLQTIDEKVDQSMQTMEKKISKVKRGMKRGLKRKRSPPAE